MTAHLRDSAIAICFFVMSLFNSL